MATGNVFRFPKRNEDGTISVPRTIQDADGNLVNITESVIDADAAPVDEKLNHIVDISYQLSRGKYTYNFEDKLKNPVAASSLCRIYYNGVYFSGEVSVSDDGYTFSFPDDCPEALFDPINTLMIDFKEK